MANPKQPESDFWRRTEVEVMIEFLEQRKVLIDKTLKLLRQLVADDDYEQYAISKARELERE